MEQATATELTDEQLRQKQAEARSRAGHETSSDSEPAPKFSPNFEPKENCIRCQKSLPEDRTIQCADCDALVAVELSKRAERDHAEATFRRLRNSGLPIDYRTGTRTIADVAGRIV